MQEPFQRPDFGVVYAYLGSLFDEGLNSQSLVDHEALLQDLGPKERGTLRQFLHNLITGLSSPDAVQMLGQVGEPAAGAAACMLLLAT